MLATYLQRLSRRTPVRYAAVDPLALWAQAMFGFHRLHPVIAGRLWNTGAGAGSLQHGYHELMHADRTHGLQDLLTHLTTAPGMANAEQEQAIQDMHQQATSRGGYLGPYLTPVFTPGETAEEGDRQSLDTLQQIYGPEARAGLLTRLQTTDHTGRPLWPHAAQLGPQVLATGELSPLAKLLYHLQMGNVLTAAGGSQIGRRGVRPASATASPSDVLRSALLAALRKNVTHRLLTAAGHKAGEIDSRPQETLPEDYYTP